MVSTTVRGKPVCLTSQRNLLAVQGFKQRAAKLQQELEEDDVYEEETLQGAITQRRSKDAELSQLWKSLNLRSVQVTGGPRRHRTTVWVLN